MLAMYLLYNILVPHTNLYTTAYHFSPNESSSPSKKVRLGQVAPRMHPVENLYHHRDQIGRFLKFLVTNLVEKLYGDFLGKSYNSCGYFWATFGKNDIWSHCDYDTYLAIIPITVSVYFTVKQFCSKDTKTKISLVDSSTRCIHRYQVRIPSHSVYVLFCRNLIGS